MRIINTFRQYFSHAPRPSALRIGEAGQSAALLAVMLPAILIMTGLLVDGGAFLVQYKRAQVAIDSAAFAAAQRIDRGQFFRDQIVVLEPNEAAAVGGQFASINSRGNVRVNSITVYGNVVIVNGYATIEPVFLKMFGYNTLTIRLSSQASPLYGIQRQGQ